MPSPVSIARAGSVFQPVAKAGKKAAVVQDAAGNAIEGLSAKPWSADGSHWELSNGNIVDLQGNVVLLRQMDEAGNAKYLSPSGVALSPDLVELTRKGELAPPEVNYDLDELAPVSQIDIGELQDFSAEPPKVEAKYSKEQPNLENIPSGIRPSQYQQAEVLRNMANNLGGDIINGAGEGVSNQAIGKFRLLWEKTDDDVRNLLLEGDDVTRSRVIASLTGRKPGPSPGIEPSAGGDAANALARVDVARSQGDKKGYVKGIKEFQRFPEAEQQAAKSLSSNSAESVSTRSAPVEQTGENSRNLRRLIEARNALKAWLSDASALPRVAQTEGPAAVGALLNQLNTFDKLLKDFNDTTDFVARAPAPRKAPQVTVVDGATGKVIPEGGAIIADDWQPEPGRGAENRAILREAERQGPERRQDGKMLRERRTDELIDRGLVNVDKSKDRADQRAEASRQLSLAEKTKLESDSNTVKQGKAVGRANKKISDLEQQINATSNPDERARLMVKYNKALAEAERLGRGFPGVGRQSQLDTAGKMVEAAVGYSGPNGERIRRTTAAISPEEAAAMREDALLYGRPIALSELPLGRTELVPRDLLTSGEYDATSAALGVGGGGKVRGGRTAAGSTADAISALVARKKVGLASPTKKRGKYLNKKTGKVIDPSEPLEVFSEPVPDSDLKRKTIKYELPIEELLGGPEALNVAKDPSQFADHLLAKSGAYGKPGSPTYEMAKENLLRAMREKWPNLEDIAPLSSKTVLPERVASNPAAPTSQSSSPARPESNPEGIPGLIARRNSARGATEPEATPITRESVAEAKQAVDSEVDGLTPEQVRAEMTRLNTEEPKPPAAAARKASTASASDDLAEVDGSLDDAVQGEDIKPSNAPELDAVQGDLEASATPVEEQAPKPRAKRSGGKRATPKAAPPEDLAPVSGNIDEVLADLEAQRRIATEDMNMAAEAQDGDAFAEAEDRARKIQQEIDRVGSGEAPSEPEPAAAAEEPAAKPARRRRGGGKKATPKATAEAAPATADELSDVTGDLEASSTPVEDVPPSPKPAPQPSPSPAPQAAPAGRTSGFTAMDDEAGTPQPLPEAEPPRRQFAEYDDEGNLVSSPDPIEERPRTSGIDEDGSPQRVRDEAEPETTRNSTDGAGDKPPTGKDGPAEKKTPWWRRKRMLIGLGAAGYAINELANQPPPKPTMEDIMNAKSDGGYMTSEERARMLLDRLNRGAPVRRPYQTGHTPIGRRGF